MLAIGAVAVLKVECACTIGEGQFSENRQQCHAVEVVRQ